MGLWKKAGCKGGFVRAGSVRAGSVRAGSVRAGSKPALLPPMHTTHLPNASSIWQRSVIQGGFRTRPYGYTFHLRTRPYGYTFHLRIRPYGYTFHLRTPALTDILFILEPALTDILFINATEKESTSSNDRVVVIQGGFRTRPYKHTQLKTNHLQERKMTYNPDIHHRRSIRLKGYDYSRAGLYFVTIITHHRLPLFGEIIEGEMILNVAGWIAENTWFDLVNHVSNVTLHEFVVMPNHVHGIIEITQSVGDCSVAEDAVRAGSKPALNHERPSVEKEPKSSNGEVVVMRAGYEPALTESAFTASAATESAHPESNKNLSEIVRQFKTFSARKINQSRNLTGTPVWLRNYHEHIIRDENSYLKIANYVQTNPQKWQEDCFFEDVKAAAMAEFLKLNNEKEIYSGLQ